MKKIFFCTPKYILIFSVLSHLYGQEGRDSKKIYTNALPIDFECFENLTEEVFISKVKTSIQKFKKFLESENNKGM